MQSSQIKNNYTILARYRLISTRTNQAVLDRNHNGSIDLGPVKNSHTTYNGSSEIEEPLLNLDLRVLRDHAELNGSSSLFMEDSLGPQSHYTGRWKGSTKKIIAQREAGDLTELSRSLNPFANVEPETVTWAIEAGNSRAPESYLYIIADKDGACG